MRRCMRKSRNGTDPGDSVSVKGFALYRREPRIHGNTEPKP